MNRKPSCLISYAHRDPDGTPERRQARFDEAGGLMRGEEKNANACCALGNGRTSSARMDNCARFFPSIRRGVTA